jgi:Trk K+ transport system NAD-binding subunit
MQGPHLMRVCCSSARSVLVLAPAGPVDADSADASTLRTILALQGMSPELRGHIVAEVRDAKNEYLLTMVGGSNLETLVGGDAVGRLLTMAARQPGLAQVYSEVLGFEGDEFYAQEWPALEGVAFGELACRFADAIPIGIKHGEALGGQTMLCPKPTYVLRKGDEVIVIAEDDDTYEPRSDAVQVDGGQLPNAVEPARTVEHILITGWRKNIGDTLRMLDQLMVRGSTITLMAAVPMDQRHAKLRQEGVESDTLRNITLEHCCGSTSSSKDIKKLPIAIFDSVMNLADECNELDITYSDCNTLATLLMLRDTFNKYHGSLKERVSHVLQGQHAKKKVVMICEILDQSTVATIAQNKPVQQSSDFVQSNQLVSQMLAMISEDRTVKGILHELLGPEGADFGVRKPSRYIAFPGKAKPPGSMSFLDVTRSSMAHGLTHDTGTLSFIEIARRAQKRGEVLLGYQMAGGMEGTDDKTPIVTIMNPRDKHVQKGCREFWKGTEFVVLSVVPPVSAVEKAAPSPAPAVTNAAVAVQRCLGRRSLSPPSGPENQFTQTAKMADRRRSDFGQGLLPLQSKKSLKVRAALACCLRVVCLRVACLFPARVPSPPPPPPPGGIVSANRENRPVHFFAQTHVIPCQTLKLLPAFACSQLQLDEKITAELIDAENRITQLEHAARSFALMLDKCMDM